MSLRNLWLEDSTLCNSLELHSAGDSVLYPDWLRKVPSVEKAVSVSSSQINCHSLQTEGTGRNFYAIFYMDFRHLFVAINLACASRAESIPRFKKLSSTKKKAFIPYSSPVLGFSSCDTGNSIRNIGGVES